MKKILIGLMVSLYSFASFGYSQVCYKNEGAYIASATFYYKDGVSGRHYKNWYTDILAGQEVCSGAFYPEQGDSVAIDVGHMVFIGVWERTCEYQEFTKSVKLVSGGTTLNFWCKVQE